MNDPFGNMNNFMYQFQNFMRNPGQFLMQSRLPQGAMQNPAGAIQQMLNSGQMTQQQFNQLTQMARQIQNNPMFSQRFR